MDWFLFMLWVIGGGIVGMIVFGIVWGMIVGVKDLDGVGCLDICDWDISWMGFCVE